MEITPFTSHTWQAFVAGEEVVFSVSANDGPNAGLPSWVKWSPDQAEAVALALIRMAAQARSSSGE